MLDIGEHHMRAFAAADRARRAEEIAASLGRMLPRQTARLAPGQAKALGLYALGRGEAFGLVSDRQFLRFAAFELLYGPDFLQNGALPFAGAIMADIAIAPWARLTRLTAEVEAATRAGRLAASQ